MGTGPSFHAKDWGAFRATTSNARSVDDIYTSNDIDSMFDPKGIKFRESCDSTEHPASRAIIVGLDVTGSMATVLDAMARHGLPKLAQELFSRKPVTDPQLMTAGIGDVEYSEGRDENTKGRGDRCPFQVTQFESDIRIAEQLVKLYLERGGGGNGWESYTLMWYFAAMHTKIDCFLKRGQKGFLFTVGDEYPTPYLRAVAIESVLGYRPEHARYTSEELLNMVSRQYEVYHLMVEDSGTHHEETSRLWTKLLGEHAIPLADHTKMAEVIVSILQVNAGEDKNAVIGSWNGDTSLVVKKAVNGLTTVDTNSELVTL